MTETVIVSTCNRSEIYGVSDGDATGEKLTRFISEWRGLDHREAVAGSFFREGSEAARHLFRVAAGLDSLALGEERGARPGSIGAPRWRGRPGPRAPCCTACSRRPSRPASACAPRPRSPDTRFRFRRSASSSRRRSSAIWRSGPSSSSAPERPARSSPSRPPPPECGTSGWPTAAAARAEALGRRLGGHRGGLGGSADASFRRPTSSSARPRARRPSCRRRDVERAMRERRGKPMFLLDLAMPRDFEAGGRGALQRLRLRARRPRRSGRGKPAPTQPRDAAGRGHPRGGARRASSAGSGTSPSFRR